MSQNWYPVIDILSCIECGTCIQFCQHGVYDKNQYPLPAIIHPEGCINNCHGCQIRCPSKAISYAGENIKNMKQSHYCCESSLDKKIRIEYLYLDLNTCDRCIETDKILDEVVAILRPGLELAGYEVEYYKHEIISEEMAKKYHFLSSPTILVNGSDIFEEITESECGCCSDIAETDICCRTFEYNEKSINVPTKEMIAYAILTHFNDNDSKCYDNYTLPENLRKFFAGKKSSQ